jgi:hypothetical protein
MNRLRAWWGVGTENELEAEKVADGWDWRVVICWGIVYTMCIDISMQRRGKAFLIVKSKCDCLNMRFKFGSCCFSNLYVMIFSKGL